jgi:hypothetical protein
MAARTKRVNLKEIIRELVAIQEQVTNSIYMTDDNCPANSAYKSIEDAMWSLTESLGMTETEAQAFIDSLQIP